jgi:hypothetical protein
LPKRPNSCWVSDKSALVRMVISGPYRNEVASAFSRRRFVAWTASLVGQALPRRSRGAKQFCMHANACVQNCGSVPSNISPLPPTLPAQLGDVVALLAFAVGWIRARSGGLGGPNSRVGAVPGGKRAPGADGLAAPGRCLGLGAADDAVGAPWRPARSSAQPDVALQGYVGPVAVVGDPQGPDSAHRAGAMVSLLGAL